MGVLVSAVRDVVVRSPEADTLALVRDIELLEPLERKARHVEVEPAVGRVGRYRITGRLFGLLPWHGEFSYVQHEHGWHSEDAVPRSNGWRVSGGFLVSRVDDTTTRITHYEDYLLPDRLRRLARPWRAYVRWTQVGEMRDLSRLVESRTRETVAETG